MSPNSRWFQKYKPSKLKEQNINPYTAISESNGTIAIFVSKMAYFKGAWRKVKVLPRP